MKKISYWAKDHIWQSRLIIITIYILLNILGIFTGKLLEDVNVNLPQFCFIACAGFTIVLWFFYPGKSKKLYVRRKLFDFSLGAITFLMIMYTGNNWAHLFIKSESAQASKIIRVSKDSTITNNRLITNFINSIKSMDVSKLSQKEKIKIIKKQIKEIKKDQETSKGEKTMLIILSVIIAIALLFLLASLACSLSCAGSEALALLVALGGTFLIIFLLVKFIKRINKPVPKNEEKVILEK